MKYLALFAIALVGLALCNPTPWEEAPPVADNSKPTIYINPGKFDTKIFDDAIQHYEKALTLNPNDASTYYNMGILYDENIDNPAKAIFCYNKYLELAPSDAPDREKVEKWNWGLPVDGLQCRIAGDKGIYSVGEPIHVFIEIKNTTNNKKNIWYRKDRTFETGWKINGQDCQMTYGLPVIMPRRDELQIISPGEIFKVEFNINNLSVPVSAHYGKDILSKSGKYAVSLKIQIYQLNEKDTWELPPILVSNTITINVTEKDYSAFSNLQEAVGFIVVCLEKENYQKLSNACVGIDKPDESILKALKEIHSKTPLTVLYVDKEFPKIETTFKLGGHMKELGFIHIDFIKNDNAWHLARIWICR